MSKNGKPTGNIMRLFFCVLLIALFLFAGAAPLVTASPPPSEQAQPTAYIEPTPAPDGRVLYQVLKGDTLWKISAVTGVSIDELERLNNIRREDPLAEGSMLVLKIVVPATVEPTLAFQPSPTPSPLPVSGKGSICVSFFNDINGDASRAEDTEGLVAGGQISVALSTGTEVGTATSDGIDDYCFKDIPSGEYTIAAAAPEKYNPTSEMNQRRVLEPGETMYISFAVQSSAPETGGGDSGGGGGSPVLAIAGVVLMGIAGLVLYSVLRPRRVGRW
jgi:hypothetical protein